MALDSDISVAVRSTLARFLSHLGLGPHCLLLFAELGPHRAAWGGLGSFEVQISRFGIQNSCLGVQIGGYAQRRERERNEIGYIFFVYACSAHYL